MVETRDIEAKQSITYSCGATVRKRSAQFLGTEAEPVPVLKSAVTAQRIGLPKWVAGPNPRP
jgi:hypothetical protein